MRHDTDCIARGLEAWHTPDIVTWEDLIERMFVLDRQAGRLGGRWLPASAAQLLWERIVREDGELHPLVATGGVGRAAWQSWRRMHEYRMSWASLDEEAALETRAFARWCRQYRQLLAARGWIDGVLAQAQVHAESAPRSMELVGFDRLTPLQESVLARWRASGIELRRREASSPPGSTVQLHCRDRAAEFEAAARWAAARVHGGRDHTVAIVVPDLARHRGEMRRALDRVLVPATGLCGGPDPESGAYELAAARPLADQPLVSAALDLLGLFLASPDLPELSRFLRNPFVAGAEVEGAARARLDAWLRREAEPGFTLGSLERLAVERDCPELASAVSAARSITSKGPEKRSLSDWSEDVFLILNALGFPARSLDSLEHQAEQRWRVLVSELGGLAEFAGRVVRGEAVGLLREMAGRTLFEPQELSAAVRVIDPDTCAGMRFDALWVCGLDAGRWPPPAAPDPFLPRREQVRAGIPRASAELATSEAAAVLGRLCSSAAEVVLSVPEMEDDAPLLASPLLAGIAAATGLPGWEGPSLAIAQYRERPPLEVVVDAQLPPIDAEESRRGGARLLELQAACPFRAQAELRLGARALEEPALGVDAAERGDLVHRALAVLWRELGDQAALLALDAPDRRRAVQRAIEQALAESARTADPLMRRLHELEADWLEARLLAMLEADAARPPFSVAEIEATRTARIGRLSLEMRPDRVDRLADGSLAVIDYKTGASAEVKAWTGERPRLPQLPAYVQALGPAQVGAVAFARVRSDSGGYVGLVRDAGAFDGLRQPGGRGWPREFADWSELLGAWQRRLAALADEYAAGDARLAPDPPRACEYCHLGALCRIAATDAAADVEDGDDG